MYELKELNQKELQNLSGGNPVLARLTYAFFKSWQAGREFYHRNCDHG